MKNPVIHPSALVLKGAVISGDVSISENVSIWYNAVIRGDIEPIIIGANSNIQECCVLHVDYGFPIKIGENVTVGHSAIIHGCEISDNVTIGMGAIILNGAKIGANTIIGAGALVTQNTVIAENSMVFGSPAKFIRTLNKEEIEKTKSNAKEYLKLSRELKAQD